MNGLVEANAAAAWVLPVVFLLAVFDGLFPPVPSESVVIGLAAFSAAGSGPNPVLLAGTAAVGAFLGDNLTYALGRRVGRRRLAETRRGRLRQALDRAAAGLVQRGAVIILVARYIPGGRVAVNLTAGATGFPRRRFVVLSAFGGTSWATYSVGIGTLGGQWVEDQPLLGAVAGIAFAATLGLVVDRLVHHRMRRGTRRAAGQDVVAASPQPRTCLSKGATKPSATQSLDARQAERGRL